MDNFKIKNLTQKQIKAVQETVLKNGGKSSLKVSSNNKQNLYLIDKKLHYDESEKVFNDHPNTEITFEEFERKYVNKLPPHISELPYIEMEVRDYEYQKWLVRKVVCLDDKYCYATSENGDKLIHWKQYRPIKPKTKITKQEVADMLKVEVENLIIE